MKHETLLLAGMLFLAAAIATARDERVSLLPKLHSGQTLTYLIHYRASKDVKTESTVAVPLAPTASQVDAQRLLRVEILDVQQIAGKPAIHARSKFITPGSPETRPPGEQKADAGQSAAPAAEVVEFTIAPDGYAEKITRSDALGTDEQQIWQEWLARFAAAWRFPAQGAKIDDKWKADQLEQAASPIAALSWIRNSEYVRNEACRPPQVSAKGEISPSSGPADSCAVILSTAKLIQKSSPKDATPDEFKLHELKTMGSARGANEIITYISLTTGLVVRATEEASQQMDVVIAKADGSNRVRYAVDARSNSEVLLVTETPLVHP
jgi:hypothetical protein